MSERGWLLARSVRVSPTRTQLEYLLADGRRRVVTIDAAYDTPELRAEIGRSLLEGRLWTPGKEKP